MIPEVAHHAVIECLPGHGLQDGLSRFDINFSLCLPPIPPHCASAVATAGESTTRVRDGKHRTTDRASMLTHHGLDGPSQSVDELLFRTTLWTFTYLPRTTRSKRNSCESLSPYHTQGMEKKPGASTPVTKYYTTATKHSGPQVSRHHSQNFVFPELDNLSNFRKFGVPYPVTYTEDLAPKQPTSHGCVHTYRIPPSCRVPRGIRHQRRR